MSKPINFLDLIKNPDKIADLNKKQGVSPSQTRTSIPKEAVIPPNLSGAQKNEWQEMQKKNKQQNENKDDDVILLERNPFIKNGKGSENIKQSLQKQTQQLQKNNSNNIYDDNNRISYQNKKSLENVSQTPIKQNSIKLVDDSINYRPSLNKQNSKGSTSMPLNQKSDSYKNFTVQGFKQDREMSNTNKSQQQEYLGQRSNQLGNIQTLNKSQSNNTVQSNRSNYSLLSSISSTKAMSKQDLLRAKYSLKQQSKQDYKKIFSRIVKEYSDEENRYYDSNKTKLSTYIIYTLIIILLIMGFFDIVARNTPKFCNKPSICQECPKNAECKNYVMRCKDGYVQTSDYTCIMNPTLISNSKNFIIDKITELQYENGHRQCFQQESSPEDEKQIKYIPLDTLISELNERLDDKKSKSSQSKVLKQFLEDKQNQQKYEFTYIGSVLSTNRLRFTLFCKTKILFQTHFYSVIISLILFVILSIIGIRVKHTVKQKQIAEEIYDELVSQIQQSSEKQINISYYKEGIVNRYKSDFNEDVWILVDRKRYDEKKINIYRDYDGLYWSQI